MTYLKTLSFLLFCCAAFSFCHAQDPPVTLDGRKLSAPLPGYYIRDVVLSQREDSCIGYINPSGPAQFLPLYFKRNIRDEVKHFLCSAMPVKDSLLPLIIRVNRLFLYESVDKVRYPTRFDLCLSFILTGDQGLIEDYTSAVSMVVKQKKFNATLAGAITAAFDSCFRQYIERKRSGLTRPEFIGLEELEKNPISSAGYFKCYSAKKRSNGIFRTFFDFRDDVPDTSVRFKVIHNYNPGKPQLSRAYLKFPEGSGPEKFWGFRENDTLYFSTGKACSPLLQEGSSFITHSRSTEYQKEVISAAVFGGIIGGMIGGALFGGLTSLMSDQNKMEKFSLDLFDGTLLPYKMKDYTIISSTLEFFLSKSSASGSSLAIFIDGVKRCEMKPGQYVSADFSCKYPVANITLVSSSGGRAELQIPLELFKTGVYLLKVKKNGEVTSNRLFDQTKRDISAGQTEENTACFLELFQK